MQKTKLKAKDPKSAEPTKPKVLLYGPPGVGKTWWALRFPSVYYIDTEGGADLSHYTDILKASGGVYMGPDDGAGDLSTVIEQVQALATESHPYKTVVIDSISKPYNTAITAEAVRLGDKDAFGASKKPAIAMMRRLVSWVDKIDMSVVFVAHEKAEWGVVNGERTQTGVTFDCLDKLEYELHLCLKALRRGPDRIAKVRKSRLLGFPDGDEFPLEYGEFAERYGKDVIERASTQVALATEAEVAEVLRILEVVKLDETTIGKWFTSAKVDNWNEMTSKQIQGCIAALRKKIA